MAATGSMRCVSFWFFLLSLTSPKLFTTSTAFDRHHIARPDSSMMTLPWSSSSRNPFTARFCPAAVWAISTHQSSLPYSSFIRIARSVALCPS